MNERLNKADLINKVSEILVDKRFVRGGNQHSWISKYNLPYAKDDIIKPVLSACFDAIVNAIGDGDTVFIKDYFTIEPRYMKAKKLNATGFNNMNINKIVPPHYKVAIVPGGKMKDALRNCTEKEISGGNYDS